MQIVLRIEDLSSGASWHMTLITRVIRLGYCSERALGSKLHSSQIGSSFADSHSADPILLWPSGQVTSYLTYEQFKAIDPRSRQVCSFDPYALHDRSGFASCRLVKMHWGPKTDLVFELTH